MGESGNEGKGKGKGKEVTCEEKARKGGCSPVHYRNAEFSSSLNESGIQAER